MNKSKKLLALSVGVMCHNEAQNILELLCSLRRQTVWRNIKEIIVISSGSTDKTNRIVLGFSKKNRKIRLVKQRQRKGKAHAVNIFLSLAKCDNLVLISADILLENTSLSALTQPLKRKQVGIVGSHPIPVNDPQTFFGFAAHLMWRLHHLVSLQNPKMGEMIAFKNCFKKIPVLSSVDEVNIEALIRGQGYKAVYAPHAVIRNKSPENLADFIIQRKRIFFGHLAAQHEYSYTVSTLNNMKILALLSKNIEYTWRFFLWTPIVVLLEIYCRIWGYIDYRYRKKNHAIWDMAVTTKHLKFVNKPLPQRYN